MTAAGGSALRTARRWGVVQAIGYLLGAAGLGITAAVWVITDDTPHVAGDSDDLEEFGQFLTGVAAALALALACVVGLAARRVSRRAARVVLAVTEIVGIAPVLLVLVVLATTHPVAGALAAMLAVAWALSTVAVLVALSRARA